MKQEVITVLVPETDGRGRYRFRIPAFFETCKSDYTRMLKALKADTENAADNARVLLEAVQEAGPAYISAWDAAGRVKDLQNIAEGKQADGKEQKSINKLIELFCSKGKKAKLRPILSRPFVSDGIVYACDAFSAVKIENRSCYTGEVLPELSDYGKTPTMGRFFENPETVKQNYKQITLPALSVLKEWGKAGKMPAEPDNAAAFKAENVCIFAPYVYRMAALTGSDTLYINPEKPFSPVYMFSENFTVLALPYRPMGNQVDYIKTLPAVCLFTYNQETGPACLDCTEAETIHAAPVKQPRKAKKTDKPAYNVQEETKPEPAAVPAGKEFSNDETGRASSDNKRTGNPETVSDIPAARAADQNQNQQKPEPAADQNQPAARLYKIGGLEYTAAELESIISRSLYLLKHTAVYAVEKTARGSFKAVKICEIDEHAARVARGGYCWISYETVKNFFPWFPSPFYKNEYTTLTANPAPAEDQEEKQAGPAETDHAAAGPEPAEKTAVIITEYRQIQEAETGHAENRPKQAAEATKDGRPIKYPYQAQNTAGTAGNRPIIKNPAGIQTDSPGNAKTCRHGIKQSTMASPLPINRQETGPPEKYRHKNGTRAGPEPFLRPSALSAPSVTFGKLK